MGIMILPVGASSEYNELCAMRIYILVVAGPITFEVWRGYRLLLGEDKRVEVDRMQYCFVFEINPKATINPFGNRWFTYRSVTFVGLAKFGDDGIHVNTTAWHDLNLIALLVTRYGEVVGLYGWRK